MAALLGHLLLAPRLALSDDIVRRNSLVHLLSGQGLDDQRYSLVGPLFAAPLHLMDRALGTVHEHALLLRYNTLLLALACLALVWLVRAREDAGRTRRFVLLLVACSM
ncbi:MAG: hypothetical protein L0Y66_13005, partial [Myxococcaceae bacterium]|nr:hypothetical protein [Myxococcaceae bacterium]